MSIWLVLLVVWAVVSVGTFCWFVWAASHAPIVPSDHPEFQHRYDHGTRLPR